MIRFAVFEIFLTQWKTQLKIILIFIFQVWRGLFPKVALILGTSVPKGQKCRSRRKCAWQLRNSSRYSPEIHRHNFWYRKTPPTFIYLLVKSVLTNECFRYFVSRFLSLLESSEDGIVIVKLDGGGVKKGTITNFTINSIETFWAFEDLTDMNPLTFL